MATLVYQCPVCEASHKVDDALFGDRVDCRECGCPFKAAIPLAHPVKGGTPETIPESHHVTAGGGTVKDTIIEVHPSKVRQSPLTSLGMVILFAAGIAGIVCGLVLSIAVWFAMVLWIGGIVLVVFSLGYFGMCWIQSLLTTLTVTDQRTILTRGLISRKTTEVRHEDVRSLSLKQGFLGRLLDVGRVSIASAGRDQREIIAKGMRNPEKIAAVIRDMQ